MQTVKHASRPHSQGQALKKELRKNAGLYLLALIPFVYLILFKYWPMYGVQIAFRDYRVADGIWGSQWVGLKHFSRFLHTPKFLDIMKNTIIISLYGVLTFPLPILLAVMLNYLSFPRYRKCIQMVSYAPHFISTVVMVAILMQFLDKNNGLLNTLIEALGGKRVNFMAKREYFYHIYQWSGVWQGLGFASIIYISALSSVPPELHEAAIVDGANKLHRIWHIDVPAILPTAIILLIMNTGNVLSIGFEKVYLMQNDLNLSVSEIISTYVYKVGLLNAQYSYSTAIGLFNNVVNLVILMSVNWISDKLSGTSLL